MNLGGECQAILCRLGGKAHTRSIGAIKNNELAFEENVTIKIYADPRAGLDATIAIRASRGIVNIITGDNSEITVDTKCKVGKSG